MSIPPDQPERPALRRPAGKPNLMGDVPASAAVHGSDPLRMLSGLDASTRPTRLTPAAGRSSRWIAAAAALLILGGGGAWWIKHQRSAPGLAVLESPVPRRAAATPTLDVLKRAAPAPGSTPAFATAASRPMNDAGATTARIETLPDARPPTAALRVVAAAPAKTMVAATSPRATSKHAPKPKPTKQELLKEQRLAAKQAAQVAAASKAARTRVAVHAPAPAPAAQPTEAAGPNGKDADIALLSALLAHVSRNAQSAPLAAPDQMTIAQVVQRCEARGGQEARECRRRICEGYWGKADACPAR